MWTVILSDRARKQLDSLDKVAENRLRKFLYGYIPNLSDPRGRGKALAGRFTGYWRYRVGDYRIICDIRDNELTILAVAIGKRDDVYKQNIR